MAEADPAFNVTFLGGAIIWDEETLEEDLHCWDTDPVVCNVIPVQSGALQGVGGLHGFKEGRFVSLVDAPKYTLEQVVGSIHLFSKG